MLIGGTTIHSALGVGVTNNPPRPTSKHSRAWSPIGILFLDEFSMCAPSFFDLMDSRLSLIKSTLLRFGGVHLVLSGDFYQLPPPKCAPIFRRPTAAELEADDNAVASDRARNLWDTCVTDFIELTEIFRQKDAVWAAALNRFRTNQPTEADIALVNSRYIGYHKKPATELFTDPVVPARADPGVLPHPKHSPAAGPVSFTAGPCSSSPTPQLHILEPSSSEDSKAVSAPFLIPPTTPAAVCWNKPREAGIQHAVGEYIKTIPPIQPGDTDWRARGVLLIQADINKCAGGQPLTEQAKRGFRNNARVGKSKIFLNLFMILGAEYMNFDNRSVQGKVSNGSVGTLDAVVLKPGARIRTVSLDDGTNVSVHAVYASQVDTLVFKHSIKNFKTLDAFPELGPGRFPVEAKTTQKKFRVSKDNSTMVKARVTQFPVGLACILTGHKMQGRSLDSIILGDLVGTHKYNSTGWLYVVLSRVRTLKGLFTLALLDTDTRKYKPRWHVIREMERLRRIEERTLERLRVAQAILDNPLETPGPDAPLLELPTGKAKHSKSSDQVPADLEGSRFSFQQPPSAEALSAVNLQFPPALLSKLSCGRRDVHFCGPAWASLGYRNSCAIDTSLFCLFVWHALYQQPPPGPGLPPQGDPAALSLTPPANDLNRQCAVIYRQTMAVLKNVLQTENAAKAWACAKHFYWQSLHAMNDLHQRLYGTEETDLWVPLHSFDNFMSLWNVLEPTLHGLGSHVLEYTRVCPDCKTPTTFDKAFTSHAFVCSLLFRNDSDGLAQDVTMGALISASLQRQKTKGNEFCPACSSPQYGSEAELGVKRDPAHSIVSARVTAVHGDFFVRFAPGCGTVSDKKMRTPDISNVLQLGNQTLYLHTIVLRPNLNHFCSLNYIPRNSATIPDGYYWYDGMEHYVMANSGGFRVVPNAVALKAKPPKLDMNEILGLCYGPVPIPETEFQTFAGCNPLDPKGSQA